MSLLFLPNEQTRTGEAASWNLDPICQTVSNLFPGVGPAPSPQARVTFLRRKKSYRSLDKIDSGKQVAPSEISRCSLSYKGCMILVICRRQSAIHATFGPNYWYIS